MTSRSRATIYCLALLGLSVTAGPPARAAEGQLELTVIEESTGKPIPCRMQLKNAAGKPFRPKKVPFWNDHFALPGTITLQLPLGNYAFELERGPEYPVTYGRFEIHHFADDAKQVTLKRHVDMSEGGWWSGDLELRRPAPEIELLMAAEDLHVAQVITWSNGKNDWTGRAPPGKQPMCTDGNRYYHLLAGSQARAGGTVLLLNLAGPQLVSASNPEYPALPELLGRVRQTPQGWIDVTRPYAWDLPVLVALRQVDSIQLAYDQLCRDRIVGGEADGRPRDKGRYPDPWGNVLWSENIYYHLLNCGLRIPPSAGSGSGLSTNPAGYNRMYVHVDGDFTYEKWWQSLRAGQVTVTNGPLLQPNVEGHYPGHVFQAEGNQPRELQIGLTLSTREQISYLDIIKDGRVEQSIPFREYAKTGHLPKLAFRESGWFLVRAVTDMPKTYRFAMTGPYFVEFAYKPRISKRSAQFFLDWVYERARQIRLDNPDQRRQVLDYHRQARDFWQGVLSRANVE